MSVTPHTLAVLLIALAGLSGCDPTASTQSTQAPLSGSWQIIDQQMIDAGIEITWTFDDTSVVISGGVGEIISRSTYTIDESHEPHHITMHVVDVVEQERPGIFSIDKDELHLSFSVDGSPRPKDFDDGESMILKRVSPTSNAD